MFIINNTLLCQKKNANTIRARERHSAGIQSSELIILQVYLPITTSDIPLIVNYNMCITQVLIIFPFLLEASK